MTVFLMYNVLVNVVGCEGGVALGSPCSQMDAEQTAVAVTSKIYLLCL